MVLEIEKALGQLTASRIAGAVGSFVIASVVLNLVRGPRLSRDIPRVGYGFGPIAKIRNFLSCFTQQYGWTEEGYLKYSKNEKTYVKPGREGVTEEAIIPRSQAMWLLNHSDQVVSTHEAHDESLHSHYNMFGGPIVADPFHTRTIHKSLARALPGLLPAIQEEVVYSVDKVYGMDTENWNKFNAWDTWQGIVPIITNRIIVGPNICRDDTFLQPCIDFANAIIMNNLMLDFVPIVFHPIVARLLTIKNWRAYWKTAKFTIPLIQKRIHDMDKKAAGDPAYDDYVEPEDFTTWAIRLAKAEGNAFALDPRNLSKWYLPLEFAVIHTTTLTGQNVMIDLFSSDPTLGYVQALREEAAQVYEEEGGKWTKEGLARLYRIDSAVRESQRIHMLALNFIERKVVAPEGITNQEGWHFPYGTMMKIPAYPVSHDPEIYDNPDAYDALRFSRPRELYQAMSPELRDSAEGLRLKRTGMVTTSDSHVAFGHGRHACPGRFFVAHELKMVFVHFLLNYDVKPLPPRAKDVWFGQNPIPPMDLSLEIKRRERPYTTADFK